MQCLMALRLSGLQRQLIPAFTVGRIRREPPSGDGCKCLMALRLSGLQRQLIPAFT
jgi:hypothetical protein